MEKTFDQALFESFVKSDNLSTLPTEAYLGDICKYHQEPWIYLHDGWKRMADENEKSR